ncbi:hypothetical protein GCM10012275_02190 [Longimycelium tulufanense]|uniref:Secreted protein n=1 Tax=Longimycelium tulufanense TaxID=907463 RepID=A0A8J3CBD7_9PSEU|nr:hypothetical protein [Longimycelium tulufanense]GGM34454.1 hypothetical protein GCM10012275_02190 [Longimycelium tulufanense]
MGLFPRAMVALSAAGVIGALGATVTLAAQPDEPSLNDEMPPAVEDYSYPGAETILRDYGVKLTSGDGHILFANCSDDGNFLKVRTQEKIGADQKGLICFRITDTPGYLNLMVPAVYEIRGDGRAPGEGHKVKAELTTDKGDRTVVDVNPHGSTPVGISTGKDGQPTTLLRLDAHP